MKTTEIYGVNKIEVSPIQEGVPNNDDIYLLKLRITYGSTTEYINLYANNKLNLKIIERKEEEKLS